MIALINMVTILMMSAKTAVLGVLKKKIFWSKGCGVIISVHDVTNKVLSLDSNYIVDVDLRPTFCNASIYMREVIIALIL